VQATEPSIEPLLPLPFPLERREKARPRVNIVLPVFNEEAVLEKTHRALAETLQTMNVDWRLIFVNDGSRDGTAGVLEKLYRQDHHVSYVLLSRNFGHQAALTAGFDNADADVIICMDADLQHPPSLLPVFLEAWRQGYDVVHTRKLMTEGLPLIRGLVTKLAYAGIQRVSEVRILPHASDYRMLDREALDAVKNLPERIRLYRGLTPWIGYRQCVIPYVAGERAAGTSQYGVRQLFRLFARGFFDFSSAPLHLGLFLGGIAVAISALYFLFIVGWLILGKETPPGWASTVSVTLLLNSVTLAFCGIIGVYVARIYDEVRARPPYVSLRIRRREPEKNE
jgi:polyisoprenyl-phosphate glycosyltransferase